MPLPSTTWATPSRAILHAGNRVTSVPANDTVPTVACTSPVMVRATVDLPAPFDPMSATTPPVGTLNDTSNSARYGP